MWLTGSLQSLSPVAALMARDRQTVAWRWLRLHGDDHLIAVQADFGIGNDVAGPVPALFRLAGH